MATRPSSVGTIFLFVDTCVWLDLAKQVDGGKMVAILRELHDQGRIRLIVPQIVLDEFERNREKVQKDMTRSVSSKFREVRNAISEHGRGDGKQVAISQLDDITHKGPLINQLATQNFDAILDLLRMNEPTTADSELTARVIERALTKLAPFHREKNSVADALLIEMYGAAVTAATEHENHFCFITHNTKDFSSNEGDVRQPHADLIGFFSQPHSHYFIDLLAALSTYLPDEMKNLDIEFDYYEEPRSLDEVHALLDKLLDQIWYNRHKNREHHIEIGEIKLVDKWQNNSSSIIQQSIWDGALVAANEIEAKYDPEDLGPWEDFEWGMLSGKLSAVRWMLGEDWETTLDT